MKVSIIVPAYNEEVNIEKCINSIMNQKYKDFELIVVDDGSKDSTLDICQKLAMKYDNLFVFHQENMGESGARNTGISKANGEFIWFVDGDDEVYEDSLQIMMDSIDEECDLCICRFDSDRECKQSDREGKYSKEDFLDEALSFEGFYYAVNWNKLYRRSVIIDNDLKFKAGIFWATDNLFNLDYYECINKKVVYNSSNIYFYSEGFGFNQTQKRTFERESAIIDIIFLLINKKKELCAKFNLKAEVINNIDNYYFNVLNDNCKKIIKEKEFKALFYKTWNSKEYRAILNNENIKGKKVTLVRLLKKIGLPYIYYH